MRSSMKKLFAICLALALLVPMAGVAEEAATNDALFVEMQSAADDIPEADVSEETDLLSGDVDAPTGDETPAAEDETPAAEDDAPATDEEALGQADGAGDEAVQNGVPKTLTLGVKMKYTLKAQSLAPGKKITYKSAKPAVAAVSAKGVITAKKKGTAKVQCYAGTTLLATCTVKVVPAPSKVTLKSAITIGVGESVTLKPTIPKGTKATYTWSSKSKAIATVTSKGVIKGKKTGTTKVTVKTQNGKTATVTVKVKSKPDRIILTRISATVRVGKKYQLYTELPAGTASYKLTWKSSDKSIATVNGSGKVTAKKAGKVKITVSTYNGKKATCTFNILPKADTSVKYRALLIGQENFSWDNCPRNRGDVTLMTNMLQSIKGLYGGGYSIMRGYDLSEAQVLDAIRITFAEADDNDVSLFFIATHGDSTSYGSYAGALSMAPEGSMLLSTLARALNAVPGKVIVILESCGSGAAIYNRNGTDSAAQLKACSDAAKAFDAAVVRAFASIDPGMEVVVEPNSLNSNGDVSNTGEFRLENKFYVLTASRFQEDSWGTANFNYFTYWLACGLMLSGSMPADTNNNSQTTLNELYKYISKEGDNYPFKDGYGNVYYQHVQVYPANSGYVLFCR